MSETKAKRYPVEVLDEYEDNGTMPENVETLADAVVGHRIVSAEMSDNLPKDADGLSWSRSRSGLVLTLDSGTQVVLRDDGDCYAYTDVRAFLLHPDKIDHIITGVGTTDGYTTWHIYADAGDVMEMTVGWSCGNPFYYAYGFSIEVVPLDQAAGSD